MPPVILRAIGAAMLAVYLAHPAAVYSQEAAPDTLQLDAVLAELFASPDLRAMRLGASVLATEADAADAWPDPSISVALQPFPIYTARGAQRSQLRVEQMLPWPGTLSRRRAVVEEASRVTDAQVMVHAADLALEATEAYIKLSRVQAIETLILRYATRLDAFAEAAAVRYEVGRGPQAAILRLQLEAGGLEARLLPLAAQRQLAVSTLARLLNRPEMEQASATVAQVGIPATTDSIVEAALRLRPEMAVLDASAEQASAEIALAEQAFYPEIGASLTYFDIAASDLPANADGRMHWP